MFFQFLIIKDYGICTFPSRLEVYSSLISLLFLFQIGDFLNFLSAVFFGVHMLRTEHIARNTDKEKFLPLLGYEVSELPFIHVSVEPRQLVNCILSIKMIRL